MTLYQQEIDCEIQSINRFDSRLFPAIINKKYNEITQLPDSTIINFIQRIIYIQANYDNKKGLIPNPNFYQMLISSLRAPPSIILVSLNYFTRLVHKKSFLLNNYPVNLIFIACLKLSYVWLLDTKYNMELWQSITLVSKQDLAKMQNLILMELDHRLFILHSCYMKWEICLLNFSNHYNFHDFPIDINQFFL